jgi:hypothetical protein
MGSYTSNGLHKPLSAQEAGEADAEELASDEKVLPAVMARLDNVGCVFKGPTFGLFGVPRNPAASLAVRREAVLLSLRAVGKCLGTPPVYYVSFTLCPAYYLLYTGLLVNVTL